MPRTSDSTHPRGFTFIEVMFAVLVLGVGVIMIAAMLPVAIRTAQETRENAAGSAAIESGFHLVEQAHAESPFGTPGTPGLVYTWPSWDTSIPAPTELMPFTMTFGNRVQTSDPTFMWIPFVARNNDVEPPQVAMVGVRARNIEQFPTSSDSDVPVPGWQYFNAFFHVDATTTPQINLDNYPLPVLVTTRLGSLAAGGDVEGDDLYTVTLVGRGGGLPEDDQIAEAMVEGAAVVVVDGQGRLRVYRIGVWDEETNDDNTWYLAPDGELDRGAILDTGSDFVVLDAVVDQPGYLVGRMLEDPNSSFSEGGLHVGPSPVTRVLDGQQVR